MITVVFTSCGRFDLLEKTMSSFSKHVDMPVEKIIVIENSAMPGAGEKIQYILEKLSIKATVIVNEKNLGQIASIDRAYSFVETDYIFHCEDDWEFFDTGFMQLSKTLLDDVPNIINVNLRVRFDNEIGAGHPILDLKQSKNGIKYHEYEFDYQGDWNGFSWNPGLRRLSDYKLIESYKFYGEESLVGKKYKELGFVGACLEKSYCRHIGTVRRVPGANE